MSDGICVRCGEPLRRDRYEHNHGRHVTPDHCMVALTNALIESRAENNRLAKQRNAYAKENGRLRTDNERLRAEADEREEYIWAAAL